VERLVGDCAYATTSIDKNMTDPTKRDRRT
jgi:hypothetical protein